MLASGFYLFIKALEYETVNPEQDATGDEGHEFDPETGEEKKVRANLHTTRNGQVSASTPADPSSGDTLGYERGSAAESGQGMPAP